jgi:predicted MFS family arabinose efflux permease
MVWNSLLACDHERPDRRLAIAALGIGQILGWGTSFYFPAVFSAAIQRDTGWPLEWIVGGTSLGLLVAGLISPQVGRLVDTRGGRPVLLASSLFYAAGLAGVGLAPALPIYLAAWVLIGLGMGTGLYDAVFAALGRMYGSGARSAIASLTLFGGFASTVCWPLSALMIDAFGWRNACFAYAVLHLVLALPLQMFAMRDGKPHAAVAAARDAGETPARLPREGLILALLATVLSLAAGVGSIVVVHLLIFLRARGLDATSAVALGTLFGPAQVAARVIERVFGGRYHPFWTMLAACALMALGLILLALNVPALALAILLYGGGFGVTWIGRGTLPLALFGPTRFPRLMGKLAFPSLIVQALAPSAGAYLIETTGTGATLGLLTGLALLNLLLIGLLWPLSRQTEPFP